MSEDKKMVFYDARKVIEELKSLSDRRGSGDHEEARGRRQELGVPIGKIKELAKKIRTNHELAKDLWKENYLESRLLATMIMDSRLVKPIDIPRILEGEKDIRVIDAFTSKVASHMVGKNQFVDDYMDGDDKFLARAAYNLIWYNVSEKAYDAREISYLLEKIRKEMKFEPREKMAAMNRTLVEIGVHYDEFTELAVATGEEIGRIDKSPVPEGCISTYAPEWIEEARRQREEDLVHP